MTERHLFIFGLGYSAEVLARQMLTEGWRVAGTCRTPEKLAYLESLGVQGRLFDGKVVSENIRASLKDASHILISIPPDAQGDIVLRHYRKTLEALPDCQWVGYLSTTGVYGDAGGEWVDESVPANPDSARQIWRVNAEQAWMDMRRVHGLPVHVFRLAGIYGPNRNALVQVRIGKAKRVEKQGQYFSRIHVEDIAQALRASMYKPTPGEIYNVCDDLPSPAEEVVAYACHIMGREPLPLVPYADAKLSEMARSFYSCSRRVRNDKLKQRLEVVLRYPDYKTGLDALWRSMQTTESAT